MFSELQGCRWEAILVSSTWRPEEEEIWETEQGHIIMCAGKSENNHGVAIVVNKKWKHKINWTSYIRERATATSATHPDVYATQWMCRPACGEGIQHDRESHQAHEAHVDHRR